MINCPLYRAEIAQKKLDLQKFEYVLVQSDVCKKHFVQEERHYKDLVKKVYKAAMSQKFETQRMEK